MSGRRRYVNCFLLAVGALVSCATVMSAGSGNHQSGRVVQAFRERKRGGYPSPDGHFAVNLQWTEEEVSLLVVVDRRTGKVVGHQALRTAQDISGFAWVPKRPHTLVFAARRRTTEKPFIGLWDVGADLLVIKAAHTPNGVDPDAEHFTIEAVSRDGRTLVYHHYDATTRAKEKNADKLERQRQYLRLSESD